MFAAVIGNVGGLKGRNVFGLNCLGFSEGTPLKRGQRFEEGIGAEKGDRGSDGGIHLQKADFIRVSDDVRDSASAIL